MLFKPVYLKSKMIEIPPTMERYVPAPQPPQIEETLVVEEINAEIESESESVPELSYTARLPILVCCSGGIQVVYPIEARRDVLAGKVPYMYIDDKGAQVFKPKHIFAALKLEKESRRKYEDYTCIGDYPQLLEDELPRRNRHNELSLHDRNDDVTNRTMSPFSRGSNRPRA